MELGKTPQRQVLDMRDADVSFFPQFFSPCDSDRLLDALIRGIDWKQKTAFLFGRQIPLPRLTAWYGDPGKSYRYSGILHIPQPWTDELLEIKTRIEKVSPCRFNSVLINRYRHGTDSMSWHSDDERELGENPVIGSVSFGQARRFHFKHKYDTDLRKALELSHGSLLLMQGPTQHFWKHQIPKSRKPMSERVNLTFRVVHQ